MHHLLHGSPLLDHAKRLIVYGGRTFRKGHCAVDSHGTIVLDSGLLVKWNTSFPKQQKNNTFIPTKSTGTRNKYFMPLYPLEVNCRF